MNQVWKCSRGGAKSRSRRSTGLCFGKQQRLVGFISKERGVIELEEDEAEEGGQTDVRTRPQASSAFHLLAADVPCPRARVRRTQQKGRLGCTWGSDRRSSPRCLPPIGCGTSLCLLSSPFWTRGLTLKSCVPGVGGPHWGRRAQLVLVLLETPTSSSLLLQQGLRFLDQDPPVH